MLTNSALFQELETLNARPSPFACYTTPLMWNDPYISEQMLVTHLDPTTDLASRKPDFIKRSVQWIADYFHVGPTARLCDLGCGPGLYTLPLAERNASVTGIDFSKRSIAYARDIARQRHLAIDYLEGDYLSWTTKSCFHLVMLIYLDFCVLSPRQTEVLLSKVYDLLVPGGAFLVDVPSWAYFEAAQEKRSYGYCASNGFWSKEAYYVFDTTFKYPQEKLLLYKSTVVESQRRREFYNWLRCYDRPSVEELMKRHGFASFDYFSDVAGTPYSEDSPTLAVVARKPSTELDSRSRINDSMKNRAS